MTNIHIAALFATSAAAHEARDQLVAVGVDAERLLVLDRGHGEAEAQPRPPRRFWDTLKQFFVPEDDAHRYADAIVRGHPLLIADVTEADREMALATLQACGPVSVETHDEASHAASAGQADSEDSLRGNRRDSVAAASSEGIVGGGVIAGDYGAVGATNVKIDTDIMRGKRVQA